MASSAVLSSAAPGYETTILRVNRRLTANDAQMAVSRIRSSWQPALKYRAIVKDNNFRKIMEAERQNQLIARIEDYDERQHALRGYL
jgi:hypothetical protein